MPVDLASLRGKVDPDVERAIRDLTGAVNKLEQSATPAAFAQVRATVGKLESALAAHLQRIEVLEGKVAFLEAQP